jgi:D-glycero-D-manno-heptose 1,7-bisphosphate phosphatase
MSGARAVFFDRDGTLMEEVNYCKDPKLVHVYPGVTSALRKLHDAGFRNFVITNQSGIGRGLMTEEEYAEVQREFLRQIGPGLVDASYYCADAPWVPSTRRKPAPGMVLEAARDHGIDLSRSFLVGDKRIDIACGQQAGMRTVLVLTGYGTEQRGPADVTAADAVDAVDWILAQR